MKKLAVIVLLALLATPLGGPASGSGQEKDIIMPYGAEVPNDPELKNLTWNRYATENFAILSIDDRQGQWLSQNMEKIRTWAMTRWGFPDTPFHKTALPDGRSEPGCRVFCVPNRNLLKKLFGLEQPKVETRVKDGRLELTVMWLVLDDKPARTVAPYLTQIALAEFEASHNVKIGWWFKRGAGLLNGTVPDIRTQLAGLTTSKYTSEKMFTMTKEDYLKESAADRQVFDRQAVALALMLRKEFGEAKLQGFLRLTSRNNPQDVLRVVYGFSGYAHFDKQYARFQRDINGEVLNSRTPDSYLTVKAVR
jgi:hypothetical protein